MKGTGKSLVRMSHMGGERDSGPPQRWHLDYSLPSGIETSLLHGKRIDSWTPIDVFDDENIAETPTLEDMPWVPLSIPIVSMKFRGLLEVVAVDHAQFLPVTVYRRGERHSGEFWMVNWLYRVDCIDRLRSNYEPLEGRPGVHMFLNWTIDDSLVPNNCKVFRVRYYEEATIVRQDLKQAIVQAGITGPQWTPVSLSVDPVDQWGRPWRLRRPGMDYVLPPRD